MKSVGSDEKMHTCTYCTKEFRYKSEKKRHEQSHNPQFECSDCGKKFSFISALRRHEKQHKRTQSVQCEQCSHKFKDEILLRRHMLYAHKGTFECNKCKSTFASEVALRTHLKTHKPESERKYHCSYVGCTKSFNFPHHLKHHELTHTDTKQYFCNRCEKGFIQQNHLKIHLKSHEPDNWLTCTVVGCTKQFSNEYARKRHLARHSTKAAKVSLPELTTYFTACDTKEIKDTTDVLDTPINLSTTFSNLSTKDKQDDTVMETTIAPVKDGTEINDREIENIENKGRECILGLNSGCICAQITSQVEYCDIEIPIQSICCDLKDNIPQSIDKNIFLNDLSTNIGTDQSKQDCKGCACSSSCKQSIEPINYCSKFKPKVNNVPEVVYRNGVIKLKDTFDSDIVNSFKTPKVPIKDNVIYRKPTEEIDRKAKMDKHVDNCDSDMGQYINKNDNMKDLEVNVKSCKDILGNCIVNGEGCLCAEMTDDQEIDIQEFEDIKTDSQNTWLT